VQFLAACQDFIRHFLGVDDPPARSHPVDLTRPDWLHMAEAIAMQYFTFKEISNRRQPDVRMCAHVDPSSR
jgi:hypothetical protein